MSIEDKFVLFANWFADQRSFKANAGTFHIDGHCNNVLVNNSTGVVQFVWNDFGKTTSYTDHPQMQAEATLASLYETTDLIASEHCGALDDACVDASLNWVQNHKLFTSPMVTNRLVGSLLLANRVAR